MHGLFVSNVTTAAGRFLVNTGTDFGIQQAQGRIKISKRDIEEGAK